MSLAKFLAFSTEKEAVGRASARPTSANSPEPHTREIRPHIHRNGQLIHLPRWKDDAENGGHSSLQSTSTSPTKPIRPSSFEEGRVVVMFLRESQRRSPASKVGDRLAAKRCPRRSTGRPISMVIPPIYMGYCAVPLPIPFLCSGLLRNQNHIRQRIFH